MTDVAVDFLPSGQLIDSRSRTLPRAFAMHA